MTGNCYFKSVFNQINADSLKHKKKKNSINTIIYFVNCMLNILSYCAGRF